MTRLRRMAPVISSIALVVATCLLGLALTVHADTKTEHLLVRDRVSEQQTLAGLGKQYVLFSLKEGLDYASSGSWQLTPGSGADRARLQSFVTHATFLNYGAALLTLGGQVLDSYAPSSGLPPPSDPGYAPMVRSMLAGQPDVSSVMEAGSVPVVAMGVPVTVGGRTAAVFVGYTDLVHSPLETYVESLRYGRTGHGYVLDSAGHVVAGPDPGAIGTELDEPQVLAALAKGKTGGIEDARRATEVTYAPLGVGGWAGATVQNANEFFGPVRSSNLRIGLALLAMLALASAVIIVLGHRQETARRRFQELLAHQAYHDGLTGLANRYLLHSRLNQAVSRARRQGSGLALVYLDLDGFKPVNDQQGHEVGDALLVAVAERLLASVRAEDVVARLGGDEFAIVMEDLDGPDAARRAAQRVVAEMSRPFVVGDLRLSVAASVGVAYSASGESDGESMLRDADLAMYRAKDAGKNGYVFAHDPLGAEERAGLEPGAGLEAGLARALAAARAAAGAAQRPS
jgi:diguanylate cyclase (GGDEF)-like protein